jgi:hypothetical protein
MRVDILRARRPQIVSLPLDTSCAASGAAVRASGEVGAADALSGAASIKLMITGVASPRRNPVSRSCRRLI